MTADNPSGIVATLRHVRQAKLCASGVRVWFQPYGHECLQTFCREGLPVEWLESLDDAFAQQIAALARAEARHGQEQ